MRLYQFIPSFELNGIECVAQPLIGDAVLLQKYRAGRYPIVALLVTYSERIARLLASPQFDLIWIEKEALPWFPSWLERLLLRGRNYVLDFDDAVFHNYDLHSWYWVRRIFGRRIDRLMAGASLVVAGNDYLASRAREAGARWVEVAPTVVDLCRYPVRTYGPGSADSPARIVWIGSPSTTQYLAALARPLARLAAEHPFVLRVIGGGTLQLPGVDVESMAWSAETEVAAVQECDVGVMPLSDTPWARGKCAYKLIQYMACGLPTVASAVGANREVTVDGETGFIVMRDDEWVGVLRRLLRDPALRRRMGDAGRRRVEQNFSLQKLAPQMCALISQAGAL